MLKEYLRRKYFRRLLAQLRGSKKIRDQGNSFFVIDLVNNLANVHLDLNINDFPRIFVGNHRCISEVLLRQLLLKNCSKIYSSVFRSFGNNKPISLPLPYAWRTNLAENGIIISDFYSQFLLLFSSLKQIVKGFAESVFFLFSNNRPSNLGCPYVVFAGITQECLPSSNDSKSYDIISWYKESIIKKADVGTIWAQAKVDKKYKVPKDLVVSSSIFPKLSSVQCYCQFIFKNMVALFVALFGVAVGKWWYGFLYHESVLLNYLNSLNINQIADEYFFPFSNYIHKPLWTYEAEDRGVPVIIYLYSGNMSDFSRNDDGKISHFIGDYNMSWNHFIVWNELQKSFLQRYCPNAKFQIVGPITMVDRGEKLNFAENHEFIIAIFDVSPIRVATYTEHGYVDCPYYSIELSLKFFEDIISTLSMPNIKLFWKQKRIHGPQRINKGFYKKRDNILKGKVEVVNPDISAIRLIKKSDAVISMPMTSTYEIGKAYGKPSIYYDAFGALDSNLFNDILILKTKNEIKEWVNSL